MTEHGEARLGEDEDALMREKEDAHRESVRERPARIAHVAVGANRSLMLAAAMAFVCGSGGASIAAAVEADRNASGEREGAAQRLAKPLNGHKAVHTKAREKARYLRKKNAELGSTAAATAQAYQDTGAITPHLPLPIRTTTEE